ncbi:SDR family NAD(P)-dependent oxidoreductase [Arenimonas donghaensis]|uniref:3-oxoacyl-ACP reductase n=1 Tax=Arenimonas donghaensis DSM 18148 = HO3-R19 TaxID=1121014 RepID=A0A087MK62_9GAMM|nr:SDR family NAD(P)-dependent oxidoreductase [Arenimonas donghaensis]KFL37265.1 hypothetical protein N788_10520 [Arenimonas donghaensis DSM 18148 = HO3-R19]
MRTSLIRLLSAALVLFPVVALAQTSISYEGKTVLVTGSTDGLGRELARSFAAEGAHVIIHGRNAERGQALVDEIAASGKGSARFVAADFSSMQAVREFADTIAADTPELDLLVNNAGVAFNDGERRTTQDGYETHFAVNYLAGWILVHELRPALKAAAPSRIINVSSGSSAPIDFDDVMLEQPGAAGRGYGQSKQAQATMTKALAASFLADGIVMISLHPATLMNTTMVEGLGIPSRTTVQDGVDHVMGLAKSPTLQAGAFYLEKGEARETMDPQGQDPDAQARLLALSKELTGVPAD